MVGYVRPSILAFLAPRAFEHQHQHDINQVLTPEFQPTHFRRSHASSSLWGAKRTDAEEEMSARNKNNYHLAFTTLVKGYLGQVSDKIQQTHAFMLDIASDAAEKTSSDIPDLALWAWQYLDRFRHLRPVLSYLSSSIPDTDLCLLQDHAATLVPTSVTFGPVDRVHFEDDTELEIWQEKLDIVEQYWTKWSLNYRQHFLYMMAHEMDSVSELLKREVSHDQRLSIMTEIIADLDREEEDARSSSPTKGYMDMLSSSTAPKQDQFTQQAMEKIGQEEELKLEMDIQSMEDIFSTCDATLMKLSNVELKDLLNVIGLKMEYPVSWTAAEDVKFGFSPYYLFQSLDAPKVGSPEKKVYDKLRMDIKRLYKYQTTNEIRDNTFEFLQDTDDLTEGGVHFQ